jgi:hypothetical protein
MSPRLTVRLRRTVRRSFTLGTLLTFIICVASQLSSGASASPHQPGAATITPSLSPDRLGAEGALRLTVNFGAGLPSGIPLPVRRAVLRFPSGLGIEIPHLRSCSIARLRKQGPNGCSSQSELGRGHALAEAMAGSQLITEDISLWLFLGPFHNLEPSFEILGQGITPFDERVVLTGTVVPDHPPYGEDLVLSAPPIPTVPLEPDASIASMSLTVGTNKSPHPNQANTIVVPSSCPTGGFPFAAEITYADGSSGSALANAACPGR